MSERLWVQALETRRLLSADVAEEVLPEETVDVEAEIIEIELDDTGSDEFTEWEDEESSIDEEEVDEDGETVTDDEFTEWEDCAIDDTEILVIDEGEGEAAGEEDSELVDPPIGRGGEFVIGDLEGEIIIWCFRDPPGEITEVYLNEIEESDAARVLLPQPTETTEETDVSAAGNESATEEFLTEKDSTFDPVDALEAISA